LGCSCLSTSIKAIMSPYFSCDSSGLSIPTDNIKAIRHVSNYSMVEKFGTL
jgi:hypothetical protein